MSRAVDGLTIFPNRCAVSAEAEHFRALMRRLEQACCVQVLTYALMSNHFHILCYIPERRLLSDAELLDSIEAGYGVVHRAKIAEQLATMAPGVAQELREHYAVRLFDVSVFFKELKSRFAQWFNRRQERYGALWAERFKSTLIEEGPALRAVAAYIDLNPLRAGLCRDPKDFRYCGYAEAVAKNCSKAKLGLNRALLLNPETPWSQVGKEYRKLLFRTGTSSSKAGAVRIHPQVAAQVIEELDGKIPLPELLRCRIRYFTDGGILGSRAFVQEQFERWRSFLRIPQSRDPRPRQLHGSDDQQIWVLRAFQRAPS
jgi:putative transposase